MRIRILLLSIPVFALLVPALVIPLSLQENSADVAGFSPIRDDSVARDFAPLIDPGGYEPPEEILYRMSQDERGRVHIAYFVIWPSEKNDGSGMGAFLSRILYTGGLSLQKLMFGPGDVEVITLVLEPVGLPDHARMNASDSAAIRQHSEQWGYRNSSARWRLAHLTFETARNYDPSEFGVNHETISLELSGMQVALPLRFRVMSWNHMFQWISSERPGDFLSPPGVNAIIDPPLVATPAGNQGQDLESRQDAQNRQDHQNKKTITEKAAPNAPGSRDVPTVPDDGTVANEGTASIDVAGPDDRASLENPAVVDDSKRMLRLRPEYFPDRRWDHFQMFKSTESLISRNRAHPPFSRESVR